MAVKNEILDSLRKPLPGAPTPVPRGNAAPPSSGVVTDRSQTAHPTKRVAFTQQQLLQRQQQQQQQIQAQLQRGDPPPPPPKIPFPETFKMTAPLSEAELRSLVLQSPLFSKMRAIKEFAALNFAVEKDEEDGEDTDADNAVDVTTTTSGDVEPVDLDSLNPRQFIVFRFGCIILDIIRRREGRPPMTLIPARRLPSADGQLRNPFKKFFLFDGVNRILYFKMNKLENVGEFLLILIHTLAHVNAEDLNENASQFSVNFHKSLSIVLDLLFYLQCRQSLTSDTVAESGNALKDIFLGCESSKERQNLIDDLFFKKVDSGRTEDGVSHEEALNERIEKISAEFKAVTGEELFSPRGREDNLNLEMASLEARGDSVFTSVQDFLQKWKEVKSPRDLIDKENETNDQEKVEELDEKVAQLVKDKKKSLGL